MLLSPELPFTFRAVRPISYLTLQTATLTLKLGVVFVVCVRQVQPHYAKLFVDFDA